MAWFIMESNPDEVGSGPDESGSIWSLIAVAVAGYIAWFLTMALLRNAGQLEGLTDVSSWAELLLTTFVVSVLFFFAIIFAFVAISAIVWNMRGQGRQEGMGCFLFLMFFAALGLMPSLALDISIWFLNTTTGTAYVMHSAWYVVSALVTVLTVSITVGLGALFADSGWSPPPYQPTSW